MHTNRTTGTHSQFEEANRRLDALEVFSFLPSDWQAWLGKMWGPGALTHRSSQLLLCIKLLCHRV